MATGVTVFVAIAVAASNSPSNRAAMIAQKSIDLCWEDQQKKSNSPGTSQFIAAACEQMEKQQHDSASNSSTAENRSPVRAPGNSPTMDELIARSTIDQCWDDHKTRATGRPAKTETDCEALERSFAEQYGRPRGTSVSHR